jgi:hypothetical protein
MIKSYYTSTNIFIYFNCIANYYCGSTWNINYDRKNDHYRKTYTHNSYRADAFCAHWLHTFASRIDHHQQLTSYDFKETFYLNIKPWNSLTTSLNLCIQRIKITHSCRSAKPSKLFLLLTLILAIDIHNNPGPIRFPCGICQKPVVTNHISIQCDKCNFWFHIKCGGITPNTYENFMNKNGNAHHVTQVTCQIRRGQ